MKRKFRAGVLSLAALMSAAGLVMADDDFDDDRRFGKRERTVATPENTLYREECGSCHLAYPPDVLPAVSWEAIMAGLENHFGDNAALPVTQLDLIRGYLLANAAQGRPSARPPLRISDSAWFRNEHDEIPRGGVSGNPQVRSFGNCEACHIDAASGSFDEHRVRIPGYGRWED